MTESPSGKQYTISYGNQRATIVEVGGALRTYAVGDRQLLDGYGEHEMASAARGQVLAPWPNRLKDGRYQWYGAEYQLGLSEPEKGNAIHGLVRFANWNCVALTTSTVELTHRLHPSPGYPFNLDLVISYRLEARGLMVSTTATNVGGQPLPYATGQHPYLLAIGDGIDQCRLQSPGSCYLPTDDGGIPTGQKLVEGTAYDFRETRTIGDVEIDLAFGDLERDGAGRAWLHFHDPNGGSVKLWVDSAYRYLELFTGDSLPEPSRRRKSLGVEPMTAPPNAMQTGEALLRLAPGESHVATWGMAFE